MITFLLFSELFSVFLFVCFFAGTISNLPLHSDVLRALKQSGPGERVRQRERGGKPILIVFLFVFFH